jgi:hypothetical protein
MPSSSTSTVYNSWSHPSYEVRVRGTVFLWGSAGISEDASFGSALHIHIRNDVFGEPITFGTRVASGAQTTIGTLKAGECFSISLQNISGVFASCGGESTVGCLIQ